MPFDAYPTVQYIQYFGAILFFAGAVGATFAPDLKIRQRAAYFASAPGFIMAWGGGHLATDHLDHELFDPWHVAAFLCLVVSMNLVHWSVVEEDRNSTPLTVGVFVAFFAAVALATSKPF